MPPNWLADERIDDRASDGSDPRGQVAMRTRATAQKLPRVVTSTSTRPTSDVGSGAEAPGSVIHS
jgi:hypothetical protein